MGKHFLENWTGYLEPMGLLFGLVLALLFVFGLVLESTDLLLIGFWACVLIFPVALIGLCLSTWLNRGAEAELRRIVDEIQKTNAPDGAKS